MDTFLILIGVVIFIFLLSFVFDLIFRDNSEPPPSLGEMSNLKGTEDEIEAESIDFSIEEINENIILKLRSKLLNIMSLGNEAIVDRLIEHERSCHPNKSEIQIYRSVIDKWEEDIRGFD